jgi:hypothetical protein
MVWGKPNPVKGIPLQKEMEFDLAIFESNLAKVG